MLLSSPSGAFLPYIVVVATIIIQLGYTYFQGVSSNTLAAYFCPYVFAANICGGRHQSREQHSWAPHQALIVNPFEKDVATMSGYYDETVTLDGIVCTALGRLLKRQANHTLKPKAPQLNIERALLELSSQRLSWKLSRGARTPQVRKRHHYNVPSAPRRRIQGPDAGHQNDTGRDATRVLGRVVQHAWLPQARQDPATGPENRPSHHTVRCKCVGQLWEVHSERKCTKPSRVMCCSNFATIPTRRRGTDAGLGPKRQHETWTFVWSPRDDTGMQWSTGDKNQVSHRANLSFSFPATDPNVSTYFQIYINTGCFVW